MTTTTVDGVTVRLGGWSGKTPFSPTVKFGKHAGQPACQGKSPGAGGYQCDKRGTLTEEGMTWCGIHAPSKKAARKDQVSARQAAEAAVRQAAYERIERILAPAVEAIRAAGLDPDHYNVGLSYKGRRELEGIDY